MRKPNWIQTWPDGSAALVWRDSTGLTGVRVLIHGWDSHAGKGVILRCVWASARTSNSDYTISNWQAAAEPPHKLSIEKIETAVRSYA